MRLQATLRRLLGTENDNNLSFEEEPLAGIQDDKQYDYDVALLRSSSHSIHGRRMLRMVAVVAVVLDFVFLVLLLVLVVHQKEVDVNQCTRELNVACNQYTRFWLIDIESVS